MFVAKSKMKRINVTVCARTNGYGANRGPVSLRLHLYAVATDASRPSLALFGFIGGFGDLISNCTSLDQFLVVHRSAQGTGGSALNDKGFEGFQTQLVEEVGAGQEHGTSASPRAWWWPCVWREARAAQPRQTDGTFPDVSLHNLSDEEMNWMKLLTSLKHK